MHLRLHVLHLLSVCFLLAASAVAQPVPPIRCGSEPASKEFLQLVRQATQSGNAAARLRAEPVRVALKAHCLVGSKYNPPTQAMLDNIVVYLDRYFKPLNVSFFWLGQPNVIRDDKYANTVDFNVLSATRAVYDVDNAVNVYFGLVSAAGGGRSFAPGPAPLKITNYLYLNALDFSPGYTSTYMLTYAIPHEFGHYFGLDHTFVNSNSATVSDRELVTRGPGANCTGKGDYVCDTPADPYDRLTTGEGGGWYIDAVNCRLVSSLVDANGEKFNPDLKNIMSYYVPSSCAGDMRFTEGQYARMRLGLDVRLTYTCLGNDVYTITGTESTLPRVSIDRLVSLENGNLTTTNTQPICTGATARIVYSTSGSFQPTETFQAEGTTNPYLNGTLTPAYTPLPSEPVPGSPNQLAVHFTDSSLANQPFPIVSIRIRPSTTTALQCIGSTYFYLYKPGTIRLTFNNSTADTMTVDFGQSVSMRIRPDQQNSGQAYGGGRLLANNIQYLYQTQGYTDGQVINLTYYKTGQIRLLDGIVPCGFVNLAGKLTVIVRPPAVALKLPGKLPVCAGTTMSLPYTSAVPFLNYRAQLSDASGQFANDSTDIIGTSQQGSIQLQFPSSLPTGSGYRIRLQINTYQGWVNALPGETIQINALPTAVLQTPPATILAGDSTRLTLQLTGTSPWQVALNNGLARTFVNQQESFYVKPVKTTTYQPTSVQDACGMGTISGSTTITVLTPLASEPLADEAVLRAWPNPTNDELTVEFSAPVSQVVTLRITDETGRQIQSVERKGGSSLSRQRLNVRLFPAGVYTLSVERAGGSQTIRFLKK